MPWNSDTNTWDPIVPKTQVFSSEKKKVKAKELALSALKVLKLHKQDHGEYSTLTVQQIADNFTNNAGGSAPLPPAKHQSLRMVLERLYHAQAISREGKGKYSFKYRILVDHWDTNDPFKFQGAKTEKPGDADEGDMDSDLDTSALEGEVKDLKDVNAVLAKRIDELKEDNTTLKDRLLAKENEGEGKIKIIHVKRYDKKEYKLKNKTFPKVFTRIKELAECRRNIMLVGPAGCGKTYIGKLLSEVLGLDFAALSCTAGMSESHLLGRSVPDFTKGKYHFQTTEFLKCYENGGVTLLDELDAADPNVLLIINSGIANGYMNIPNRPDNPIAWRHDDHVMVGSCNTFGRGASRMYAGRNQIDEATMDRFRIGLVECHYDLSVEKHVCPDDGPEFIPPAKHESTDDVVSRLLALDYGLRGTCQYIRYKIESQGTGLRRLMSSRFMEDAYIMMDKGGWSNRQILETFFEGWTDEEKAKI